ncbi:transposase [Candidatus Enterovibrio altilux]|nr:transposase [Candidatus Enterovibrio luxaltus]
MVTITNQWHQHNTSNDNMAKEIPHQFDAKKQENFTYHYDALKTVYTKEASSLFIDTIHPIQATQITYEWIRKSKNKVLEAVSIRSHNNIMQDLDFSDIKDPLVNTYKAITSAHITHFSSKLRKNCPPTHQLHIVLDKTAYHRSNFVKNAVFILKIKLHYFPPLYNSDLNPLKQLWQIMNEQSSTSVYYKNQHWFKEAIIQLFTGTISKITGYLTFKVNNQSQFFASVSSS